MSSDGCASQFYNKDVFLWISKSWRDEKIGCAIRLEHRVLLAREGPRRWRGRAAEGVRGTVPTSSIRRGMPRTTPSCTRCWR